MRSVVCPGVIFFFWVLYGSHTGKFLELKTMPRVLPSSFPESGCGPPFSEAKINSLEVCVHHTVCVCVSPVTLNSLRRISLEALNLSDHKSENPEP